MRIVQLIYSISSGGAERFVVDLSNELVRRGHEVYLVVFRSGQRAEFYRSQLDKDVKFLNLDIKAGFGLGKVAKVIRCLLRISPDVVHAHLNVIPYLYPMVIFSKKINFFHTLHNLAEYTSGGKIQAKINKNFYKRKFIVPIAISNSCGESYIEYYDLPAAPVVENGRSMVEPSGLFSEVKSELAALLDGREIPVFLHVARFSEQKNQDLLISSFNRIHEEGVDYLLLIIGGGYDSPGKAKELRDKACESIKFLGEIKNVGDYFLLADAFCLSSRYEGLPISLLEALSAGCVPICTAVGGIPDVIIDGETGYLSFDNNVESYCRAVRRFLESPAAIDRGALIAFYERRYSIERCADSYLSLYGDPREAGGAQK